MAQLFRLNVTSDGATTSLTLKIGKALGATTEAIAIAVLLIGAAYFLKQQNGLMKGVILSRGWDVPFIALLSFVVSPRVNIAERLDQVLTCPDSCSLSSLVFLQRRIVGDASVSVLLPLSKWPKLMLLAWLSEDDVRRRGVVSIE